MTKQKKVSTPQYRSNLITLHTYFLAPTQESEFVGSPLHPEPILPTATKDTQSAGALTRHSIDQRQQFVLNSLHA
jgi:hypothetical protein